MKIGRMDCALKISPSSICSLRKQSLLCCYHFDGRNSRLNPKSVSGNHKNDAVSRSSSPSRSNAAIAGNNVHRQKSSLESLFCYDKPVSEEIIDKPIGLSLAEKNIGDNPCCSICVAKGVVLCTTCSGSGLYVDSILESQGIIVKVRCLGCGGSGNTMCSECGGRGHI